MSKGKAKYRPRATQAQLAAAAVDLRDDALFEALVAMAALVARADGWVQDVERRQLLDFFDQMNLLAVFAAEDVETHFEHCVRELREPGGPSAIVHRLRRHADTSLAPLIVRVGEAVAAADCRLDPREEKVLRHVRATLGGGAG